MRKQLSTLHFIFSLSIIFLLSLGYLGGIYFLLNQPFERFEQKEWNPVTSLPVSLTLNLSSPDNNLLVTNPDLLIAGKTTPGAIVILSSHTNDLVLEPTKTGDFSTTIKLQTGLNNLTVSVFDNLENSKSEERTIYYSKEKI